MGHRPNASVRAHKNMKKPPILLFALLAFLIFTLCSIGINYFFKLPWQIDIPRFPLIFIGILLLAIGFPLMISAYLTLTPRRAFGREIHAPKSESKLVTSGIYSYTRNPLYLSSTILFLGWFFIFRATFIFILMLFFLVHFCIVAKWEERELASRFGEKYLQYKKRVPFFIPSFKKNPEIKN